MQLCLCPNCDHVPYIPMVISEVTHVKCYTCCRLDCSMDYCEENTILGMCDATIKMFSLYSLYL